MNKIKTFYAELENGEKIKLNLSEETQTELMKQLEKPKSNKWIPEVGQEYFYLNSRGNNCFDRWANDAVDRYRLQNNDVFETEEEARKYRKVHKALLQLAEEFPVDWKDLKQKKYTLCYDYDREETRRFIWRGAKVQGSIAVSCEDIIEEMLEKVTTEELDWYLQR